MWKHVNSKHILHANDEVMRHARFGYDMHGHDHDDDDDDDDELYQFVCVCLKSSAVVSTRNAHEQCTKCIMGYPWCGEGANPNQQTDLNWH